MTTKAKCIKDRHLVEESGRVVMDVIFTLGTFSETKDMDMEFNSYSLRDLKVNSEMVSFAGTLLDISPTVASTIRYGKATTVCLK